MIFLAFYSFKLSYLLSEKKESFFPNLLILILPSLFSYIFPGQARPRGRVSTFSASQKGFLERERDTRERETRWEILLEVRGGGEGRKLLPPSAPP